MTTSQGLQTAPCVCEPTSALTSEGLETETTVAIVTVQPDNSVIVGIVGEEAPVKKAPKKRTKTRKVVSKPRRKLAPSYRISLDGGRRIVELPRGYKPARWFKEGRKLYYSTLWYQGRLTPAERGGDWEERSFRDKNGEFDRQSWRTWRNKLAKLEATPKFLPAASPDPAEQHWFITELGEAAMEANADWNFPQNWPVLLVEPQPEFVQVHDRDLDVWTKATPDPDWTYVQLPYHYEVRDRETGESHRRTHKADKAWGLLDFGMWVPKAILQSICLEQAQIFCDQLDELMAEVDAINAETAD